MADIAVHEGAHAHEHDAHGAHATSTGLSNNKLAMWLFLGTECLLFGGLISTYMLYRGRLGNGPGRARCSTSRSPRSAASSC